MRHAVVGGQEVGDRKLGQALCLQGKDGFGLGFGELEKRVTEKCVKTVLANQGLIN